VAGDIIPPQTIRTATQHQQQIRAVTVDPSGDFFFSGKVDGTVWYNKTHGGRSPKCLVTHDGSVRHLLWGNKTGILIVATDNCPEPKLTVHPVRISLSEAVRVLPPIFIVTSGVYVPWALLLNSTEDLLLVMKGISVTLMNLGSKTTVFRFHNDWGLSWKWKTNPADETERILWLAKEATIWDWLAVPSEQPRAMLPIMIPGDPVLISVTNVFENRKVLLAVTANLKRSSNVVASLEYYLLDIAPLDTKTGALTPSRAFGAFRSRIGSIVGSYGSRLVFLDDRHRVCSVELLNRGGNEGFRHATHFFIPSYWCEDLTWFPLAKLTPRGDILVRKGPDVVIIKNGLAFEDEVWEVFDD
jgi:hypothetical protein